MIVNLQSDTATNKALACTQILVFKRPENSSYLFTEHQIHVAMAVDILGGASYAVPTTLDESLLWGCCTC